MRISLADGGTGSASEASRDGYDTIAVRPLYGDNKYSIGHVRVF